MGVFLSKRSSYASQYIQIYLFSWQVTNNIYQKQIKYHVFNAVTNSELTELVPVFTIRPVFPTSVKKVNTSFKNVWRTWGPALLTLLADLMIFWPLGPTNFKNSVIGCVSGLTLEGNWGEEVALWLLTSLCTSAKREVEVAL